MDVKRYVLLLLSISMLPAVSWAGETLTIVLGESKTIARDYAIGDAAITNPDICDYVIRDGRKEVYLNALQSGSATLTLWDSAGVQRDALTIHVTSVDVQAVHQQVSQALGDLPIDVEHRGDHIRITGAVDRAADLQRIQGVAAQYEGVHSAVELSRRALSTLAAEMTQAIGRPGITARSLKGRLILEGVAYSKQSALHAEHIAKLYAPDVLNMIEVHNTGRQPGKRPLVVLDVYFMEVKKSALKTFGISWNPGALMEDAGSGIGGAVGSTMGFVSNLLPKIRWANERGDAKILEHPQIVVKSGDAVSFFSGSEIPYSTEHSVEFKNVGIDIQAEPIAAGKDVDLKLTATLSSLGSGVTQAIDRRTITTSAYCQHNQSIVLAGLWSHHESNSRNKLPRGINTSTAIFQLNKSKDFQRNASEFLVFVRPRIAKHAPSAVQAEADWKALQADMVERAQEEAKPKPRRRMHNRFSRRKKNAAHREKPAPAPQPSSAAGIGAIQVPESLL